MQTTIDGAGRLVVPKHFREHLGLVGGTKVIVEERDGVLEIRPAGREVTLESSEGRPVLRAPADAPRLTVRQVRDILEQTRR